MQKTDTKNSNVEAPALLPTNISREFLKNLDGWQSTEDRKMIYREFICHDFMASIDMVDHIARIAQDEQHHPDIHLTQYRNLRVALTTHDVGGLSDKDFAVASKINELPFSKEHQQLQKTKQASRVSAETKTQSKKSKSIGVAAKKNDKKKGSHSKKIVNRMGSTHQKSMR